MQIQKVNNAPDYRPIFQANLVGRASAKIGEKAEKTVVEVYSVSKKDKTFLERFLNILNVNGFLKDEKAAAANGDVKGALKNAIKKAMNMDNADSYDRVLISVEDNKKITGIIDYGVNGDMNVNSFAAWADNGRSMSRKALLLSALNSTKKAKDYAFEIPLRNLSEKGQQYFKNLGFSVDKKSKNMFIDFDKLGEKIENIKTKSKFDFKQTRKEVDLNELF